MANAPTISSAANPLLKDVRRAAARGTLTQRGCCVAEGLHLLEEALRSGCEVDAVLASESALPRTELYGRQKPRMAVTAVPDKLFQRLTTTETSQGVIALVKPPAWQLEQLLPGTPLVMVLDGLQDPGNAGTIVRAAEAFGASGVLFLKGTVSPFNPKTLRAAAGSLFRLPFLQGIDAEYALSALIRGQVALYAAVPPGRGGAARPVAGIDLRAPCALIVGSEAHGVGPAFGGAATGVYIPTAGVESLNAGVAAAVLLYEARRQRETKP